TLIVIYAGGYLAGHPQLGRFYATILIFLASMLGVVLANNIFTLFVFWELTSISSFLLIGFDHRREAARRAALQSLLVTGGGGLALLAGLILLGQVGQSFELTTLLGQNELIQQHPLYLPILLLILLGAFTKSAQVPFHFWLPNAMEAPTPVSAYLHSATMVKVGVYLIARFSPLLGGTDSWFVLVTLTGTVTMLFGAGLALLQTDLKRILAYSTISALGTLIMLLGIGTTLAAEAAVLFLLVHSLYKGSLFLVAGAVDQETGVRDIRWLGGLGRLMPIIALAAGLSALSMAGVPFLLGFIGKELIYETTLHLPDASTWLTAAAVLANIAMVAVAGIVGFRPFFGQRVETPKAPHRAPLTLWLGPLILAGLGLVTGSLPGTISDTIIGPAAGGILAQPAHVELAIFHGFNTSLLLSVVTLLGGAGVFAARSLVRRTMPIFEMAANWGPETWYNMTLAGLEITARKLTDTLQSGYLRSYLLIIIVSNVALVGYTLVIENGLNIALAWPQIRFYEGVVAGVILLAAFTAARTRSRLAAVAALGVVGYGVALLFVFFGAPDLAMTQFSIETLTVILLVLILSRLPRFKTFTDKRTRNRDMIVALTAGGLMTLLVLTVTALPFQSRLTPFFAENSLTMAHGRNIVNVILVDFRGLDTLGEITVLSVAAAGVFALLKLRLGDESLVSQAGEDGQDATKRPEQTGLFHTEPHLIKRERGDF
ncbi:MAG TPA: putative monovalent cation/H+ antiporter subunit A, partial [Anaerolineae bacterium]